MTPKMQALKSALLAEKGTALWLAAASWWDEKTPGLSVLLNSSNQASTSEFIGRFAAEHGLAIQFIPLPGCFLEGLRLSENEIRLTTADSTSLEVLAEALVYIMQRFDLVNIELRLPTGAPEAPRMSLLVEQQHCAEVNDVLAYLRKQIALFVAESPLGRQAAFTGHLATVVRALESLQTAVLLLDPGSRPPANFKLLNGTHLEYSVDGALVRVPVDFATTSEQIIRRNPGSAK